MSSGAECVFCRRLAQGALLLDRPLVAAFPDGFPLSPGHTLVIPRRHEASPFALPTSELAALWEAVAAVRQLLVESHRPDGFNIGVNVGLAAGQTVGHAHVHVIPRYAGDAEDPRGGVRWVLPAKARYWSEP